MITELTRTMNAERTRNDSESVPCSVPFRFRGNKGFTLLEFLVILAIAGVITVISWTSLSTFNTDKALSLEADKVLSLLSKARAYALSAKEDSVYGVRFEERRAVLFKGGSYSAGAATNRAQELNDAVKISAIALAGGAVDVVFKRLTGATTQNGTVTLSVVRDASKTKVITIEATGISHSN